MLHDSRRFEGARPGAGSAVDCGDRGDPDRDYHVPEAVSAAPTVCVLPKSGLVTGRMPMSTGGTHSPCFAALLVPSSSFMLAVRAAATPTPASPPRLLAIRP